MSREAESGVFATRFAGLQRMELEREERATDEVVNLQLLLHY